VARARCNRSYIVFYELPSARGKSSALPGQDQPSWEIQVSSQPITLPAAQGAIEAANGRSGDLRYEPWPRTTVRLRNGEKVVVIPDAGEGTGPIRAGFLVITEETLVKVTGEFTLGEIRSLAEQLVRERGRGCAGRSRTNVRVRPSRSQLRP
jgi:hypothetical protein